MRRTRRALRAISTWCSGRRTLWGKLSAHVRNHLIEQDREFLREQLANENVGLVLANGGKVIDELCRGDLSMKPCGVATDPKGLTTQIQMAHADDVVYIGWRVNLQSTPGVTGVLREAIAARVGELAAHSGFAL